MGTDANNPEKTDDATQRSIALLDELTEKIDRSRIRATFNYYSAYLIALLTLISGAYVAYVGFTDQGTARSAVVLGLIPASLTLLGSNFKLQERANWHSRKGHGLEGIRRMILYESSVPITLEEVKKVSEVLTEFDAKIRTEWQQNFSFLWIAPKLDGASSKIYKS